MLKLAVCLFVTAVAMQAAGVMADDCADLGVPTQCSLTTGCQTCYSASQSPTVFCARVGSSTDGGRP